mmetsp:Transcript_3491/g.7718  ORF Transcript_3491/g.7718 Transcript_3491/m.7718 type:complete len:253 (-) Transcript_3491:72-830(-)
MLARQHDGHLKSPATKRSSSLHTDVASSNNNKTFNGVLLCLERIDHLKRTLLLTNSEYVAKVRVIHANICRREGFRTSSKHELIVGNFFRVSKRDFTLVSIQGNCLGVGHQVDVMFLIPLGKLAVATSANTGVKPWEACTHLGSRRMQKSLGKSRSLIRRHWLRTDDRHTLIIRVAHLYEVLGQVPRRVTSSNTHQIIMIFATAHVGYPYIFCLNFPQPRSPLRVLRCKYQPTIFVYFRFAAIWSQPRSISF